MYVRRSVLLIFVLILFYAGTGATFSQSSAASSRTVYLPAIVVSGADLSIAGIEITQSVQTSTNSLPLVAGRATVVRVYAVVDQATAIDSIALTLSGTRNGTPLPGSPLRVAPRAVSPNPQRSDYTSSYNLTLPAEWLYGTVSLVATIDSGQRWSEANEYNNTATATLQFNSVPPLNIQIVPIRYTHLPDGRVFPPPSQDTISDWIRRTYPISTINITFRTPIDFGGDLRDGGDWQRLLYVLTSVKFTDGAPDSLIYYGLIPTTNGADTWMPPGSIIAGIGWVGERVATSLEFGPGKQETTGRIAAHEVGHNLGRYHAPCGTPGNSLQPFPYQSASIGPDTYGLDLSTGRLWRPGPPDNTRDLMSYCTPQWLSDFTYRALFDSQRLAAVRAAEPPGTGLLIRAVFDQQGGISLQPSYTVSGAPTRGIAQSDYAVELIGTNGELLARYPVELLTAEQEPPSLAGEPQSLSPALADRMEAFLPPVHAIQAIVPLPEQPITQVRLVHQGTLVVQQTFPNTSLKASVAHIQPSITNNGETLTLRWEAGDVPVLVRYTIDEHTWITLGVDLTGGSLQIVPDTLPGPHGRFEIIPAQSK